MAGLRKFMFENVYMNPKAKGEEDKAVHLIEQLYDYYIRHPELLPGQYLRSMERTGTCREQTVCDYIAGMTDNYAVKKYEEFFVPEAWKN
jgi:dGTPase